MEMEIGMSSEAQRGESYLLTAGKFMATPQIAFGWAWRYELIDGVPMARPAPTDQQRLIQKNLSVALKQHLHGSGRTIRIDDAVMPSDTHRRNVRFPDVLVRCLDKPVAMFEILSPFDDGASALQKAWRRIHLKRVWGAEVLIEIEQVAPLIHMNRRIGDLWTRDELIGMEETLLIEAIGVKMPLSEVYGQLFDDSDQNEAQE
jgi:hypothetical protein